MITPIGPDIRILAVSYAAGGCSSGGRSADSLLVGCVAGGFASGSESGGTLPALLASSARCLHIAPSFPGAPAPPWGGNVSPPGKLPPLSASRTTSGIPNVPLGSSCCLLFQVRGLGEAPVRELQRP